MTARTTFTTKEEDIDFSQRSHFSDNLGTKNLVKNGVYCTYYAGFGGSQIDILTLNNGKEKWSCGGWGEKPNRIWIRTGTIYYVRLEKSGENITLNIFFDPERTRHIPGSPKSVTTSLSATTFNYFYAIAGSYGPGEWEWTSGWIDNIKLSIK